MVRAPEELSPARRAVRAGRRSRFGLLFVVLVLTLVVPSLLPASSRVTTLVLSVGVMLALLSGLWAVSQTSRQGVFGVLLLAAAVVLTVLQHATESPGLDIAAVAAAALFLAYLTWSTLAYVLAAVRVDANILFAAACVYLLGGFLCGMLYALIELAHGGAASVVTLSGSVDGAKLTADTMYYSFVTLTTLGYGDVAPVAPTTRAVAILEALLGQLYLVMLVARLVALHIMHGPSEDD